MTDKLLGSYLGNRQGTTIPGQDMRMGNN